MPTPEPFAVLGLEVVKLQIYTWIDPLTNTPYHFNATAMLEAALAKTADAEYIKFVIEDEDIEHIIRHRGVDIAYARCLTTEQLKQPVIAIYNSNDDTTLTVDGHHRLVRIWELGMTEWLMARFKPGTWKKYLLQLSPADSAKLVGEVNALPKDEVPADQKAFSPEDE